ncbi:hypothetical protein AGMMS49940_11410 [Spirochaetia bacterium]|nr:hypothetical protein AGMMS49940_11410 [Spirochaetia bacterium]
MFNPKISGIAAGAGFILSFLLGIIAGASFPLVLIRAFVFAALFFALVSAGYWAIGRYLPELLDAVPEKPTLGARVDISVGDDTEISLNEFRENPGESGGGALDQNDEYSYTGTDPLEMDFPAVEGDSVDALPDLDLMSGAFSSGAPVETDSPETGRGLASTGSLFDIEAKAEKKGPAGEFAGKNVQEMASAIQTILKREDKG